MSPSDSGLLTALLDSVTDGVLVLDAGGRVKSCNSSACELLGRTSDDLLGDPIDLPNPDGDRDVLVEFPRVDGRELVVRIQSTRVFEAGQEWTLLVLQDRTTIEEAQRERERAEEALRMREAELFESQKLEAVGRLAGGIAHDYNNVLGGILGNAELILQELGEDHRLRENMEEIRELTNRSAKLTRQLLAFSRRQHLEPVEVDLREEIRSLEPLFERLLGERIEVEMRLEAARPVLVDPSQIQQVVLNLLINARDEMSDGGRVVLQLSERLVGEAFTTVFGESVEPGRYVQLSVRDQGGGVDPEILPRVVEPFFTTRAEGTGLGLSTVFGIVQQSGGALDYTNAIGGGAEFCILLPAVGTSTGTPEEASEVSEEREEADTGAFVPGKVLVIEDEDRLRVVIRKMLRRAGFEVIEARDGSEALEIDRPTLEEVGIVLSDLVMPGDPGPEVVRKLRLKVPDLPVVYMTGYSEAEISEAARDAGPILPKPFSFEALIARLKAATAT